MWLFKKRSILSFALLSGFCLPHFIANKNSSHINEMDIAPQGMVAYAASYSSNVEDEPNYGTQNTKTFQYLNLGTSLNYYRGDSVKVGIIDSGINYDHEDFMVNNATKVKGDSKYYEYQNNQWVYYGASQRGYTYIDDSLGHGTNVAATVAAAINSVGGAGLAPNVELYVYKVTNSSNGYEFGAIQLALNNAVSLGINVINMSFQSYENEVTYGTSTMPASKGCSTILSSYLNYAHNNGITLVGAAGNYNTSEKSYPGSNNYVINVGSLSSDGTAKAPFSNYGSSIDLVAPGYVYVADKGTNSSYKNTSGTSFSAPLVTAAIALYKQQNPSATPSEIETALYASCDPIDSGSTYSNWAGHGSLNVERFLGLSGDEPTVSSVTLSAENLELDLYNDKTATLTATVNGEHNPSQEVTWNSSNSSVATVSNGVVTAEAVGTTTVTATSVLNPNKSATCNVTVKDSTPSSESKYTIGWGTATGTSGTYSNYTATSGSVNNLLSFSCQKNNGTNDPAYNSSNSELRLYYNSGGKGNSITIVPATGVTFTNVVITTSTSPNVKYSVDGGSLTSVSASNYKYTISAVNVQSSLFIQNANTSNTQLRIKTIEITYSQEEAAILSNISLNTDNVTKQFAEGDTFNYNGLVVTANYENKASEVVTPTSITSPDMTVLGNTEIEVSYTENNVTKTASYYIDIVAGTLDHIVVEGQTTSYKINSSFSFDGTCTAIFANGYQKTVTPTNVTSPDMSKAGTQTITVTYSYNNVEKSTSYEIDIVTYRDVYETVTVETTIGSVVYTSGNEVKPTCLSTSKSGYTNIEDAPNASKKALRLGSGSNKGTLTITNTASFNKVVVHMRTYSSDSGVNVTIGGSSYTITSTYNDYVKEYTSPTTSVSIATTTNGKRAWINTVTLYSDTTTIENIGQTEDCLGLESFINTNLHMDYVDNLGYCKDEVHHYYATAKTAFNALNEHQRSLFVSNSAYEVEYARLSAWAKANGEDFDSNNTLVKLNYADDLYNIESSDSSIIFVIIIASISTLTLTFLLVYKKKKSRI